jgi:hypothetical protein
MRTSFELKIIAPNLKEAKQLAIEEIGAFLGIDQEEVLDQVSIEFKVTYAEAKTRKEIAEELDQMDFVVTVFGSVKQSVAKPF